MVPMMMVVAARNRLRLILNVGELPALRGGSEVRGQLVELVRGGRVAVRSGGLVGALQVGRNVLRPFRLFRWVGLLKLLQGTQQLGKGRELVGILRVPERDAAGAAGAPAGRTGTPQCRGEQRLEVSTVGSRKGIDIHDDMPGNFQPTRETIKITRLKSAPGVNSLTGDILLANQPPAGRGPGCGLAGESACPTLHGLIMAVHTVDTIRDRSVLITGAGRGVGKRLAMGFAEAGAHIGLLARSKAELDLAKLEIEQAGGRALRLPADVRNLDEMKNAAALMIGEFGRLDVLIVSAGVQGPIGLLLSTKPEAWADTIQTNLIGAVNACRAALPPMIEKRSGKIILIVGGSRGLGVFIAHAFVDLKVKQALVAHPGENLEELRKEIENQGGKAIAITCDLRDVVQRRQLFQDVRKQLGPIDILVNNAGVEFTSVYHELSEENIYGMLRVNLEAPMILSKLILPEMLERKRGHIVNISSLAGKAGPAFQEPYAATKAGLIAFTASLRATYRGSGVSASVIVPGFVEAGVYARLKAVTGRDRKSGE